MRRRPRQSRPNSALFEETPFLSRRTMPAVTPAYLQDVAQGLDAMIEAQRDVIRRQTRQRLPSVRAKQELMLEDRNYDWRTFGQGGRG